jgi:hypothetical protein
MAYNKTRRNKTRRNKSEGGGSCGMSANAVANMGAPKLMGGKRRNKSRRSGGTRKLSKGASSWHKQMMEVYRDMKKKDPSVKLGDAMRKAAEMKKKGQL